MAGNFNRIGYLKGDYGNNRWINNFGDFSVSIAVNNDKITINDADGTGDCIPVSRPYECYIKTGTEFRNYIYSANADQLYYIRAEDTYPAGYEPFKIYKR